jgi:hypothetical protein
MEEGELEQMKQQPLEAGNSKEKILSWGLQKESALSTPGV